MTNNVVEAALKNERIRKDEKTCDDMLRIFDCICQKMQELAI